jgi:putative tryptophan/tyrosine transport system substrate-binding protein
MNRRDLITLFGGIAVAWPVRARAQQADRVRRIGVLLPYAENDPEAKSHLSAFTQELKRHGWSEGNIHIDTRLRPGWQTNIHCSRRSWLRSNPT